MSGLTKKLTQNQHFCVRAHNHVNTKSTLPYQGSQSSKHRNTDSLLGLTVELTQNQHSYVRAHDQVNTESTLLCQASLSSKHMINTPVLCQNQVDAELNNPLSGLTIK